MLEVKQILPMFAKTVREEKQNLLLSDPGFVAEQKLDGERGLIHVRADGSAVITSRRISKVTGRYAEKTENVPQLTRPGTWPTDLAESVFDAEMVHPGGFEFTAKVFRSLPAKAVRFQTEVGPIKACIFDVLYFRGENVMGDPWSERRSMIQAQIPVLPENVYLSRTEYFKKKEFLTEIWRLGGEGVVLKPVDSLYVSGNRSIWVKIKREFTVDVVVLGFVQPEMEYTGKYKWDWPYWAVRGCRGGSWEKVRFEDPKDEAAQLFEKGYECVPVNSSWWNGWFAGIRFGQYIGEELVELGQCSGYDTDLAEELVEDPDKFIGRVMEVKANGRFKSGRLRHPQFKRWREDKGPEDCIWNGETV